MRQNEQQVTQDHPEAVRSTPVPVPEGATSNGRPGNRADGPEDALDDRGTFDDPKVADGRDARPDFHEPAPVPTTFGATTVGGAVAASAMAGDRPEDERDPRGEETARPGDGAPGRTDRFDDERADPTAADRLHQGGPVGRHADRGDETVADRDATEDTGAAGYGRPAPTMVDPDADGKTGLGDAAKGGTETVPGGAATLFASETAQGFRDRWRDVQLRFVDDPKAAAGQAQSLVDEAIQALAAALAAQKEKLGSWQDADSADTEDLRVAVRQYRDFLDRVLGR
ncbi:hypothetical protein [Micromonospora sp. SH-82]|uniref:hypothetical protein n=1 Tax=Micromonospora sp. SH-82 TaxID=3132938 RepID=UPI003EB8F958